ncbi:hypothetical protein [Uliginosibacterium sediminicola]|uniref:Type VI secretion system spike protein VgrG3-like C-terminal domain-containing protein n=1 Tax=Uliginosibacterium sediminicola TaxID=2024550 RepID=A0ABU9YVV1_9RHOO
MVLGDRLASESSWFRKIFGELRLFRRDESLFNKAANKSLKNIEERPSAAVRSEGGPLASLPGARMLSGLPLVGRLFGGGSSLLAGGAGRLLRGGGGILRRLPLLGALLASVGAGLDIADSENGDSLTRQQKNARNGRAIGGASGTIGGAALGAAIGTTILPGVGTALGAVIGGFLGDQGGQIIGEKVGAAFEDIKRNIETAWTVAVGVFEDVGKEVGETWRSVTAAFDSALGAVNQWIKDKTGIDAGATYENARASVTETAGRAANAAGETGSKALDWLGKNTTIGKGITEIKRRWDEAWQLGDTSKRFESGKAGAGAVSGGKGDNGGASYGTYQLSSKKGVVQDFISRSGYAAQFAGLQPGTPAFDAKWKEIAASDPGFADKQHDYIKATHYDPMMAKLKASGLDLSGRGSAVQDAIWSTAVQFGPGSDLISKALGKNAASMTDAQIIDAIQGYKLANNDRLFARSSEAVRAGTARRAANERSTLLARNEQEIAAASVPVSSLPRLPQVSVASDAPRVVVPLASSADGKGGPVVVVSNEVGQDLSDRGIAHAVTGGISGG